MKPLTEILRHAIRDYIIGVDERFSDRVVGQFALIFIRGKLRHIIWKSFPVGNKPKWLAGFGTKYGRCCNRVVKSSLGKSIILVCHDAQAFNHRNIANVKRTTKITDRRKVINEMHRQMKKEKPLWAFNLIHYIGKQKNLKTFSTSYKQISEDYSWSPSVVGSFGFGKDVIQFQHLINLSRRADWSGNVGCVLAIRA